MQGKLKGKWSQWNEMLTKGSNSVRSSNNAATNRTFWHWIPETTEQNLIKFILHLYQEVQSTISVLGDKIFPGKLFYQPFIFEIQTGSEQNKDKFQTKILF